MSERELLALVKAHRADSLGAEHGDLSNERAKAMDHYHGRPYGNEVTGRSSVVSRDLAEAVDWALPAIMRVFTQSGNVGEFDPVGPDDEKAAQQESDYVNQIIMKDNSGFLLLHDAIKDTLLLKNGYVKHYWEDYQKSEETTYEGLMLEQIQQMLEQWEGEGTKAEFTGWDSQIVQIPMMGEVELFDLKVRLTKSKGKCCVLAVPSEEVRVSKKCRGSLQDSPFTEHVTHKTRSDCIEMGMPKDFVYSLPAYREQQHDSQAQSRDTVLDEGDEDSAIVDKAMEELEFCEAYIRVDYDGDGIAELRKVVTVAGELPPGEKWNEPIPAVPMTSFVMKRVPHRHVGESLDDEISDLQEIHTTLERQLLDNVYLVNSSEKVVNDRANLKDFMTTLPGGIKRIRGDGAVGDAFMPLITPSIIDKILPVIDHIDKRKEIRTGIRPGSDLDPDVLKATTKGAFMEHLNRASQKIELITRMIAETGVKEVFLQVHGILQRHQDVARMVQLRGEWVNVNPQEWQERTDLSVKVGLGTGNEEEKRNKLMMLSQLQGQLLMAAGSAPPPVYDKLHALFEDVSKTLGFDVPGKYSISPKSEEYQALQQNKPPPPEMMKVQMDAKEAQARMQQEAQLEQMRMQMQQSTDRNRQEMEAQEAQARMQMDMALARAKAEMEMTLEREKAQMKMQLDMALARMNNEAKLDAAQIAAQTTLSTQQEAASDQAVQE